MENARYREYELELAVGDALFLYTGGVTEAADGKNALYGTGRLLDALGREPDASPERLLQIVKRDIDRFVGDVPQFDDITMLAIQRKPAPINQPEGSAGFGAPGGGERV